MIERKLTAGFILALAIQTGGALIWAGAAAERIEALERRADLARPVGERLARLEAKLDAIDAQLDRTAHPAVSATIADMTEMAIWMFSSSPIDTVIE